MPRPAQDHPTRRPDTGSAVWVVQSEGLEEVRQVTSVQAVTVAKAMQEAVDQRFRAGLPGLYGRHLATARLGDVGNALVRHPPLA